MCSRCVLARPIVLGPGRKKSQGPGFGVEDRLPRQKPPTLGVQGAPPAPRTTVSGAARSDLTCELRPLRVRGGCHGSQARKEPPAEGENGDARAGAEHARVGCAAVRPRWESGGLIAATPSGRAPEGVRRPSAGLPLVDGGGGRVRGAFRADGAIPMGTRVTARATQCGTGSRAAGLQRVTVRRVGDSTPMARPHEGEEGQHVLWRPADAQPNSGSGAMSTRAATPGCSGEGAMTSSTARCALGSTGSQDSVDEVSPPRSDCECALRKRARVARVFGLEPRADFKCALRKRARVARVSEMEPGSGRTVRRTMSMKCAHPSGDCQCALRKRARVARVFGLQQGMVAPRTGQCRWVAPTKCRLRMCPSQTRACCARFRAAGTRWVALCRQRHRC